MTRLYRRTPKPPNRAITLDELHVGYERIWEKEITQELVFWYADLAEDYSSWYGLFESPFGDPVAPPLLISRIAIWTTEPLGRMKGFVNTRNFTEILGPVFVGTRLRLHGRITNKYVKRGRWYIDQVVEARETETERLVLRDSKTYMVARSAMET